MAKKPLIAGNWKMNGLRIGLAELATMDAAAPDLGCDILVCPPATLLASAAAAVRSGIALGGQTCHNEENGAHTGEISAGMLADAGATHVIVGHSERRSDAGETDEAVLAKAKAAWGAGLTAVICIGETEAQRDAGQTLDILGSQLQGSVPDEADAENTVVAYEPVWAIGTGRTPTIADIAEIHAFLRSRLVARFGADVGGAIRLLYGGSVKPSNAAELLSVPDVDGALVGGASLKAADFIAICEACPRG